MKERRYSYLPKYAVGLLPTIPQHEHAEGCSCHSANGADAIAPQGGNILIPCWDNSPIGFGGLNDAESNWLTTLIGAPPCDPTGGGFGGWTPSGYPGPGTNFGSSSSEGISTGSGGMATSVPIKIDCSIDNYWNQINDAVTDTARQLKDAKQNAIVGALKGCNAKLDASINCMQSQGSFPKASVIKCVNTPGLAGHTEYAPREITVNPAQMHALHAPGYKQQELNATIMHEFAHACTIPDKANTDKEILELDAQVMTFLYETGRGGWMDDVLLGSYRANLDKMKWDRENKNHGSDRDTILKSNYFTLDTRTGKVTMTCDDGSTRDVATMPI